MTALEYATADAVRSRIELNEDEQTDWSDDEVAMLEAIVGQVNDYVEDKLEVPAGPSDSTSLLLDGTGTRVVFLRIGVRTLTQLEVRAYTGADWETITIGDVFLRPLEHDRQPGIPAQQIWLSDYPTGSYSRFPGGFANVRPTGDFGLAEMPPRAIEIAETTAARAWLARRAGQRDMTGNDEQGHPLVSRYVAYRDRMTLERIRNTLRKFTT